MAVRSRFSSLDLVGMAVIFTSTNLVMVDYLPADLQTRISGTQHNLWLRIGSFNTVSELLKLDGCGHTYHI